MSYDSETWPNDCIRPDAYGNNEYAVIPESSGNQSDGFRVSHNMIFVMPESSGNQSYGIGAGYTDTGNENLLTRESSGNQSYGIGAGYTNTGNRNLVTPYPDFANFQQYLYNTACDVFEEVGDDKYESPYKRKLYEKLVGTYGEDYVKQEFPMSRQVLPPTETAHGPGNRRTVTHRPDIICGTDNDARASFIIEVKSKKSLEECDKDQVQKYIKTAMRTDIPVFRVGVLINFHKRRTNRIPDIEYIDYIEH